MSGQEQAAALIARLAPAITTVLAMLEYAARHVAPDTLAELGALLDSRDAPLRDAFADSQALDWPEAWHPVRDCLEDAAGKALAAMAEFAGADGDLRRAGRALRVATHATEALYPLAGFLRGVSAFFIEAEQRDDAALAAKLASVQPGRDGVGTMHLGGPPGMRGGATLYVPEYYDEARDWPLVVALHGGSGEGSAFLWTWLREARTRGVILLAPTAAGPTWSLTEPEEDGPLVAQHIAELSRRWRIDPRRVLLTGMSDGGTFTYSWGLGMDCPATHLAPVAAGYNPILMGFADIERLPGLPVRITHGARDWMFRAETAREAALALRSGGAVVEHVEIADLAHAWPREQNGPILDWFLGPP